MKEFEVFSGTNNIILVAPHAYPGDDDTGAITRLIQKKLDCYAVLNTVYRKPKRKEKPRCSTIYKICNLDDIDEYETKIPDVYNEFVRSIVQYKHEIIGREDKPYIFYIHCGSVSLFNNACKDIVEASNAEVDILIGSGKGIITGAKDESLTATEKEVQDLVESFESKGIVSFPTNSLHFSAGKPSNLNQLFRQARFFPDKRVTSFHLEFRKHILRDENDNLADIAQRLSAAINMFTGGTELAEPEDTVDEQVSVIDTDKLLVGSTVNTDDSLLMSEEQPDIKLVKEAHAKLAGIFFSHYKNALLEAGQYIIDSFYDGRIELARLKTPTKDLSYTQLVQHLQKQQEDSPKKSWLFNAVNLVIQEHDFSAVQALGQLNTSQKLLLLPVSDQAKKQSLAEEAVIKNYTTRQLAEAIKKTKAPRKKTLYTCLARPEELFSAEYSHLYSTEALETIKPKGLKTLRDKIKTQTEEVIEGIREQEHYLERYKALMDTLDSVAENNE